MSTILLEEKYIFEYIGDTLNSYSSKVRVVENARYHHNTSYQEAITICKYGILSLKDQQKLGIKKYSNELLKKMSDIESHVNGSDAISLAVVGLNDLYDGEEEYDPFSATQVDFLVSSSVKAGRSSIHYGNEFLSYSNISIDKLKAIDIRLLKLLETINTDYFYKNHSIESVIKKYNCLREIASTIKEYQLDIPLREMSDSLSELDIDKLSKTPKILLIENGKCV